MSKHSRLYSSHSLSLSVSWSRRRNSQRVLRCHNSLQFADYFGVANSLETLVSQFFWHYFVGFWFAHVSQVVSAFRERERERCGMAVASLLASRSSSCLLRNRRVSYLTPSCATSSRLQLSSAPPPPDSTHFTSAGVVIASSSSLQHLGRSKPLVPSFLRRRFLVFPAAFVGLLAAGMGSPVPVLAKAKTSEAEEVIAFFFFFFFIFFLGFSPASVPVLSRAVDFADSQNPEN